MQRLENSPSQLVVVLKFPEVLLVFFLYLIWEHFHSALVVCLFPNFTASCCVIIIIIITPNMHALLLLSSSLSVISVPFHMCKWGNNLHLSSPPLPPPGCPPATPQIRTGDESKVGLSCRNASSEESQLLKHERPRLRQLVPVDIRHPAGLHSLLFLKERRGAAVCIARRFRGVFSDGTRTPPERLEAAVRGSPTFFFFYSLDFGWWTSRFWSFATVRLRSRGVARLLPPAPQTHT